MKGFRETNKSNKKKSITLQEKYNDNEKLNKAIKFHYKGNIAQASQIYKSLIDKGFKNSTIYTNYGLILINFGKFKDAEFFIRKAIELNPKDSIAYYNLGGILKNKKKLKDAEYCIRKAIELNPKDSVAHYNLGIILKDLGKLEESELSYRKAIQIKPDYAEAHYNLGIILKDLGKLEESELSYRKAIQIKPDYAEAHYNLGNLLSNFGKLEESELSYYKVIELNPNYTKAYYSLSLLKYSDENKKWKNLLFSKNILKKKSKKDQINIYFARANILHKEKNYEESSRFLKIANQLKLVLRPSNSDALIKKSKELLIESIKSEVEEKIKKTENKESQESVFIVGMPRSGSTLLESILSTNNFVYDLKESNILEESFLDYKKSNHELNLAYRYWEKINDHNKKANTTTNKNLYNYLYTGIIANKIPNSKIIHCYRNPLDNILSIYRAHFAKGNQYSSSLVDCAMVYLNQEEIMRKYKAKFRSKIYDLNYDLLVCNPKEEIKSLISWLGWQWSDAYLSPHLNPRTVFSASKVQIRSQINSKSINGWKNYRDMLQPCIEIITKSKKYQNLLS